MHCFLVAIATLFFGENQEDKQKQIEKTQIHEVTSCHKGEILFLSAMRPISKCTELREYLLQPYLTKEGDIFNLELQAAIIKDIIEQQSADPIKNDNEINKNKLELLSIQNEILNCKIKRPENPSLDYYSRKNSRALMTLLAEFDVKYNNDKNFTIYEVTRQSSEMESYRVVFKYIKKLRLPGFKSKEEIEKFHLVYEGAIFIDKYLNYLVADGLQVASNGEFSKPIKVNWLPGKSLCLENPELRQLLMDLVIDLSPRDSRILIESKIIPEDLQFYDLAKMDDYKPLAAESQERLREIFKAPIAKLVLARDQSEAWERPYFALAELNARRLLDTFKMENDLALAEKYDAEFAAQIAAIGKHPLARYAWGQRLDMWLARFDLPRAEKTFADFAATLPADLLPYWRMVYEDNRDYFKYPGFQSPQELIYGPRTCDPRYFLSRKKLGDSFLDFMAKNNPDKSWETVRLLTPSHDKAEGKKP